jgi:hypothetical protein
LKSVLKGIDSQVLSTFLEATTGTSQPEGKRDKKQDRVWWYTSVIPATQEAEIERITI